MNAGNLYHDCTSVHSWQTFGFVFGYFDPKHNCRTASVLGRSPLLAEKACSWTLQFHIGDIIASTLVAWTFYKQSNRCLDVSSLEAFLSTIKDAQCYLNQEFLFEYPITSGLQTRPDQWDFLLYKKCSSQCRQVGPPNPQVTDILQSRFPQDTVIALRYGRYVFQGTDIHMQVQVNFDTMRIDVTNPSV